MATPPNDRVRPRLRKGREAKDKPPGGSLLGRLQRQLQRPSSGWHKRGWRGVYVVAPGAWAQQVVVKAAIMRPGMSGHASWKASLRQHLDYLQREGVARGGEAGPLSTPTATGVETSGFLGRSATDPHQFRLIVSAEDGADLDLTRFTRAFMGQVEADLGTRLDWVAVNHYDTNHPHTHILLRGTDADGQSLTIQRSYMTYGMRHRAQELATRELGPRITREVTQEPVRTRAPQTTRDRGLDLDV
jgi:type IV secretory pathway VirD2 relaxase